MKGITVMHNNILSNFLVLYMYACTLIFSIEIDLHFLIHLRSDIFLDTAVGWLAIFSISLSDKVILAFIFSSK